MRLSEMIEQAIIALRDDGISEPTNDDIQRVIFVLYGIEVSCEDIAKVRNNPPKELS